MTQIRIETREQPGGRTGTNVTVSVHLGCIGHSFTMPYTAETEDPHRQAVEQMVQRLRSKRHLIFTKDEPVKIERLDEVHGAIQWVAVNR